jgi:tetratricopeptide (TPR) repeat protein
MLGRLLRSEAKRAVSATEATASATSKPAVADQGCSRALALFAAGRDWEARKAFERARAIGALNPECSRKLGWVRFALSDATGAEAAMREALAGAPDEWASHYALGAVLRGRDDRTAMIALTAALDRAPGNVECFLALSSCARSLGDAGVAERYARNALAVAPGCRDAWLSLGVALLAQERPQEAHDARERAEKLSDDAPGDRPDNLDRGLALRLLGRTWDAIDYYESKLPEAPEASAQGQYALALLTAGDFHRGWQQYEFRWFDPALAAQRAHYGRPQWRGEDLHGKTILLRCEQGVGDVLQFIRYAPLVKARGATILLELRPGLGALPDSFWGIDAAFPHGQVTRDFDYWCDLLSVPLALNTTFDTIPADIPYLRVDAERRARWRERIARAPAPRVGIVWAGDPRHPRDRQRSIPLDVLESLLGVVRVSWFSLQKGSAAAALTTKRVGCQLTDLASEFDDFADTAAVIDVLDLIVTVDTSVAHLAGALGKPVWMLTSTPADWRWLEDRDDSPWYPTMRLFRQKTAGNWGDVVARVVTALEALRDGIHNNLPTSAPRAVLPVARIRGSRTPKRVTRTCHTRVGRMQYLPESGTVATSLEHYGEHLQAEVDLLSRLVRPDRVIVEHGAGFGYHAIALAPLAGTEGQILAIEPSRTWRMMLRQNITASDAKRVSVMPLGAAGMTLDALDFERLDLVKINDPVFGETLAESAAATLWKLRPTLFVKQASWKSLDALAVRMVDFGYRCWGVETPMFNPSNFNRNENNVFADVRVLALLALPEECEFILPSDMAVTITPAGS